MSGGPTRFMGRLDRLTPSDREALIERAVPDERQVRDDVAAVIEAVRDDGDAAVRRFTEQFDRVTLTTLEVPRDQWSQALKRLEPAERSAFERAARNIATAHRAWLPSAQSIETEPGVLLERRPYPLHRVGVYAPGGLAAYPTSVLMGVIPAKVAGVSEVVVCSPAGESGRPADSVLAACELAGADRVFAIGGAQAIAAMALGTESVPRVERIVGPGNAYVMEAKVQLSSQVSIDSPAGPSEVLVIADGSSDPDVVATELIAQAEHDPNAVAVAIVIGAPAVAGRISERVAIRLLDSPREEIVAQSLVSLGAILEVDTLDQAVAFAEEFAAEHLLLAFDNAAAVKDRFRTAGAVFVGASSSVAFGDYLTGGNHVLPTSGLARSYSGLSTADFIRWTNYQTVSREAAARLAGDTRRLALAEGLPAHAETVLRWGTDA